MITRTRPPKSWAEPTVPAQIVHGRVTGKIAAALAVTCAVVHIPVVLTHLSTYPLITLTMLVLTVICLSCVTRLWHGPLLKDWGAIAALAASMLALHLFMTTSMNHPVDATLAPATPHHGIAMPDAPGQAMHMSGTTQQLYHLATALALTQMMLGLGVLINRLLARAGTTTTSPAH